MKPTDHTAPKPDPADVLPAAALTALLLDAAPVDLPSGLADRVRARLTARLGSQAAEPVAKPAATVPHAVAAEANEFINIRYADGWTPWPGAGGQAEVKTLFDDGCTVSLLVRMAPGCELDGHDHIVGPEECLCVEGDVWLNDKRLAAGDYEVALAGTRHQRIRSDSGCLLFVRAPSPQVTAALTNSA